MSETQLYNGIEILAAIGKRRYFPGIRAITTKYKPQEAKCSVCGRNVSELKPFGGHQHHYAREFRRKFLLKRLRPEYPCNKDHRNI